MSFKFVLFVYLFFVVLFSFPVFALESDVNSVEYLVVDTSITIPISFVKKNSNSFLEQASINYSWLPVEDYRQEVLSVSSSPSSLIRGDSAYYSTDVLQDFDFVIDFSTKTYASPLRIDKKVDFPLNDLDYDFVYYTSETELIDINDDIRDLASKLANEEDDLFVVVFKIADWVNTNIDYNLSSVTADASLPSSWVLENRRGVCDEMSNLFVSMVRSLGIPARVVTGVAYTDSDLFIDRWGPHGWAEVYFPDYGWVPFDPTYNQLGFVDASHIKLDQGLDSERFNTGYSWRGSGVDLVPGKHSMDNFILEKGVVLKENVVVDLEYLSDDVGFGSYNVLKANVRNLNDYYVAFPLTVASMKGVDVLDEFTKDLLLLPGDETEVSWILRVDDNHLDNYIYEFPMFVYTAGGFNVSRSFSSKKSSQKFSFEAAQVFAVNSVSQIDSNINFRCIPDKKSVYVNESLEVHCTINNDRNENVRVCVDQRDCVVATPDMYDFVVLNYSFNEPGFRTFVVEAKKLPFVEQSFVSVNVVDDIRVDFGFLSVPDVVDYDDLLNVSFSLIEVSGDAFNVSVELVHDFFSETWNFDSLESIHQFSYLVPAKNLKVGENEFLIKVTYHDLLNKEFVVEDVLSSRVDSNFFESILMFFNFVGVYVNNFVGGL
ncbi:transglutaminase-like domain-containing protein [Candidatus Woesearchaeota archaeon]|nr:transglutaminase-like domain-containing protein [Candidatus Woesearchaeota archaeon]